MTFVSELEPTELWQHFDRILTIPRGSKNEEAISEYVISIAAKHGLAYSRDQAGNIVVRKPAAAGCESTLGTILQSHLDMVNEKNADVEHDFSRDPIKPRREDGYLKASGTTLGSDNGIGVAACLALMENDSVRHGPLEFLFTVDEETGLTGAAGLQPGFLLGQQLINLDTEEEGAFYVGCAGGAGVNLDLQLAFETLLSGLEAYELKLHGLKGGHSGVDIHLQRGNAIQLLARVLVGVAESQGFDLVCLQGGNMHNAIPREASATLCLARGAGEAFKVELDAHLDQIREEFRPAEPNLGWKLSSAPLPQRAFTREITGTVLSLLIALPHGVVSMSYDIPDLVETSANLATVRVEEGTLKIHVSNRSSVDSALEALQRRVACIGTLAGATAQFGEGYPGWKPNLESRILKVAQGVHERLFGRQPEVKAVHAGLECGLIGERYPGMDMVSMGPQIEFPHSPDERVQIASVADFHRLLIGLLEALAEEG